MEVSMEDLGSMACAMDVVNVSLSMDPNTKGNSEKEISMDKEK